MYGFSAVEATNFPRTRLVSESYLVRRKNQKLGLQQTLGMADGSIYEVSLIGAVQRGRQVPDLLYALTAHQPRQPICNIVQWSCQILGESRSIFLGKLLTILRVFSPGMLEITYTGKTMGEGVAMCTDNFLVS